MSDGRPSYEKIIDALLRGSSSEPETPPPKRGRVAISDPPPRDTASSSSSHLQHADQSGGDIPLQQPRVETVVIIDSDDDAIVWKACSTLMASFAEWPVWPRHVLVDVVPLVAVLFGGRTSAAYPRRTAVGLVFARGRKEAPHPMLLPGI